MKAVKIDIQSAVFPDQFVSDSKKATQEFGLQVGQAIQYEWFRKDGMNCRFYNQWADFLKLIAMQWMPCLQKKEINSKKWLRLMLRHKIYSIK